MSRIFSTSGTIYKLLEQDMELQIALSQISSGCVPHATDDECLMIFKEEPDRITSVVDTKKISTRFFAVEKEEFPSVAMEIRITTSGGLGLKYEYFFLTESSEETFFLATLEKLGVYSIIFLCDDTRHAVTVAMTRTEMDSLKALVCGTDTD